MLQREREKKRKGEKNKETSLPFCSETTNKRLSTRKEGKKKDNKREENRF
jgi:hypothetical protein